MGYQNYSNEQIEAMSDALNRKYDRRRLYKAIPIDIYDIIDLVGARISIDYLSPDRTYLGATVFSSGYLYVWPDNPYVPGMIPIKKYYTGGTIIIDRDLSESELEQDFFTENFTVAHECFHFDYHQSLFNEEAHFSRSFTKYSEDKANPYSIISKAEHQANYGAATFLMPRKAVINTAEDMLDYKGDALDFGYGIKGTIKEMGKMFGVNYTPMVYRLQELNILDTKFNPYI